MGEVSSKAVDAPVYELSTPPEAGVYLDGCWYKLGAFGRAYMYVNDCWVASSKAGSDVLAAIENKVQKDVKQ